MKVQATAKVTVFSLLEASVCLRLPPLIHPPPSQITAGPPRVLDRRGISIRWPARLVRARSWCGAVRSGGIRSSRGSGGLRSGGICYVQPDDSNPLTSTFSIKFKSHHRGDLRFGASECGLLAQKLEARRIRRHQACSGFRASASTQPPRRGTSPIPRRGAM